MDTILYKILPTLPYTNWNVLKYLSEFLFELSLPSNNANLNPQSQQQQIVEPEKKILSPTHSLTRLQISGGSSTFSSTHSTSLPFPSPRSVSLPLPVNKNSPSSSPSTTPRSVPGSQPSSPRYAPPSPSASLLDLTIPHLAAQFAPLIIKRKKSADNSSDLTSEELSKKLQRTVMVFETILNNQHRLFAERL